MEKKETKSKAMVKRRWPIGAELLSKRGVHFRVWAPRREKVHLVLEKKPGNKSGSDPVFGKEMIPEPKGYFSVQIPEASGGTLYRFKLDDDERLYPDPASRYQPDGPEGPSQIVDPFQYQWTDQEWRGVKIDGQVVYEMHIGTFTREGTWKAACKHLKELAETGVSLLEIMPVADFGGRFGWGYDGVNMYAPTRLYGSPEDFRRFVDHAHSVGLGVILDVVYNHFGPVGNYISQFSIDYFTDRYETDWGYALNFDGKNSGPVREFFIQNAICWISEFHLDGLRIDATQSIIDKSPIHVLSELAKKVRSAVKDRAIVIIAENEPQDVRLVRATADGGFGLDGIWNDDFHHSAMVALTGRNEAYYTDYLGKPQEFVSAAKWGFLYQSQHYTWQKKRRGTPAWGLKPAVFINYIQNHDQVANSARGERCHFLTSPAKHRAITAFFLLIAGTPMLFQGQEFSASSPFLYFADQEGDLAETVRQGRADFLKQFKSLSNPDVQAHLHDPSDPNTFERCKLDHNEKKSNAESYALHRDLLSLRRTDAVFREQRTDWMHGAVIGEEAFALRFFGEDKGDRLILVNFGRDLHFWPAPEPLLAPPEDTLWEVLWSSESVRYGGAGIPELETEAKLHLPGNAAIVLAPKKLVKLQ